MNDQTKLGQSLHDQFVARENPHNQQMSKESIRSGNAMMVENIMNMPVQPYQDGKAVYRVAEIRGRQSGQIRRTPLAVFQYDGKRYLIAPTHQRDWVHNLIAAGECNLVTKAQKEHVKVTHTLDDEAITGVRAYMAQLQDWALVQFPFKANASSEEMHAKKDQFAVFHLS